MDALAAKLEVLREHCSRVGRDYEEIRRTILYTGGLDPTDAAAGAAFVEEMKAYADLGVTEVHVMPYSADPVAFVRGLGDHVVPGLATRLTGAVRWTPCASRPGTSTRCPPGCPGSWSGWT